MLWQLNTLPQTKHEGYYVCTKTTNDLLLPYASYESNKYRKLKANVDIQKKRSKWKIAKL